MSSDKELSINLQRAVSTLDKCIARLMDDIVKGEIGVGKAIAAIRKAATVLNKRE